MTIIRRVVVRGHNYEVQFPNQCPICHHYSEMATIHAEECGTDNKVQLVARCAFAGCQSYFICYYGNLGTGTLHKVKPIMPILSEFPDEIGRISPTFLEVFAEAEEAALLGLSQIAGPGYRKAFEYLVKDYAKSLAPEECDNIEKMFSGNVVVKYITDIRIQGIAKRCLWLGNDESHYLKTWTNHDLSDLKILIKLATNWIEIGHLTNAYTASMPDKP